MSGTCKVGCCRVRCDYPKEPEYIGDCDWCGQAVYDVDDYEPGNAGEGVMHANCEERYVPDAERQ